HPSKLVSRRRATDHQKPRNSTRRPVGIRGRNPMPQSIPKGLSRECILQTLADLDVGIEHPFGPPTGYELVHEGRRYPPKAVIGLACRSLLGRILQPDEFSGGEAPGQANFVLRELGFMVVRKDASPGPEASEEALEPGHPW